MQGYREFCVVDVLKWSRSNHQRGNSFGECYVGASTGPTTWWISLTVNNYVVEESENNRTWNTSLVLNLIYWK